MISKRILAAFILVAASLTAFADDLPDLAAIAERHRATLDSIRSGRITYVEERTLGTDDVEEFKKYYREDMQETLRKWKAGGADKQSVDMWQGEVDNYEKAAARRLVTGTVRKRINCVFDRDQDAVKEESVDLRDIEGLLRQYNVQESATFHNQGTLTRTSSGIYKYFFARMNALLIDTPDSAELVDEIEPLGIDGFFTRVKEPGTAGADENIESVRYYRDSANPDLIIEEVVNLPEDNEQFYVVKEGATTEVELPREEPLVRKSVKVLDGSMDYRVVSESLFENGRLRREYSYEYSDEDSHGLPSKRSVTTYRKDGSIEGTRVISLESVQVNVTIEASELELSLPPGTAILDHRSGKPVLLQSEPIENITADLDAPQAEEMTAADLEETPTAPEPPVEVEPGPAAGELTSEIPVEEEPAPQEDGPVPIITVGIALVIIAIIIAVAVWARRRQRN